MIINILISAALQEIGWISGTSIEEILESDPGLESLTETVNELAPHVGVTPNIQARDILKTYWSDDEDTIQAFNESME